MRGRIGAGVAATLLVAGGVAITAGNAFADRTVTLAEQRVADELVVVDGVAPGAGVPSQSEVDGVEGRRSSRAREVHDALTGDDELAPEDGAAFGRSVARNARERGGHGAEVGRAGEAPGNSGDAPGNSGDAPGNSGEAPGRSGEAPGRSGDAPGQSGEAPRRSDG